MTWWPAPWLPARSLLPAGFSGLKTRAARWAAAGRWPAPRELGVCRSGTAASSAQYGYWGFLSPALILYFLLRGKGEAYRKYQKATSPFIPWFPNYK